MCRICYTPTPRKAISHELSNHTIQPNDKGNTVNKLQKCLKWVTHRHLEPTHVHLNSLQVHSKSRLLNHNSFGAKTKHLKIPSTQSKVKKKN